MSESKSISQRRNMFKRFDERGGAEFFFFFGFGVWLMGSPGSTEGGLE